MPGEDEGPPGDPAPESARLESVAARLETLGAALQRSIGETTESTASLSRTVGTVSADLGRLIGEAVTALGKTRQIVLATDDSVGSVAVAFEQIERRLTGLAAELAESIERQRRIEEDKPTAEVLGAAVGAEVAAALQALAERFSAQVERVTTELEHERADRTALAEQVQSLHDAAEAALTDADVRAQVEAVVTPVVAELRDELARMLAETHDDRAELSRRLAGRRDVEQLRELIENLAARDDVVELQAVVEEAMATRDDGVLERLRTDLLALADDMATTAKRAGAGQRAIEALQATVEQDLPAEIGRAVGTASGEIKHETETLVSELHDDLGLVMRQVVSGNEELEALRETIAELTAAQTESAAATEPAPLVRSVRDDVMGAVGDLHEDLALVLKRLAAGQRELDDLRETVIGATPAATASIDEDALAGRVRDELVAPLAEMGDDLSVLVRSLARTQEDIDALRASVAEIADAVVAETEDVADEEEAFEEDAGPDLAALVEGLRADIDAGIGAAVTDLRDELDSVRRLLSDQAQPLAAGDIRSEVEAVIADIRDDLALLGQQLVTGQDEVAVLRSELLETLLAGPPHEEAEAPVDGVGDELRTEIAALADELRGQFDRLRAVVGRARSEPELPDVAGEVAAAIEPVVAALHDDLAALAGQLDDARVAIEAVHADVAFGPAATEGLGVGAEMEAVVADLHEDLSLLLGQVVAAQEELRTVRDEVGGGQDDLRAVVDAVAAGQDDVRVVLEALVAGQDDVRALRDEVAAALEVTTAPTVPDIEPLEIAIADLPVVIANELRAELLAASGGAGVDIEPLEIAVADLPAVVAGELRAELEVVADDIRARLRQLEALAEEGAQAGGGVDPSALRSIRDEVQALANDVQTDLGTVIQEVVAGHGEVSQLRAEVASIGDAMADALPQPVEDPALAIEGMRVDLTASLADLAAELRADLEGLVAELHEDLGTLMRQVVAGQDDLDALRQQLAEIAELAASGGTDQVADDLDRLTRDLQALRDRIPGAPAAPARRRPRAHPGR